MKLVIAFLLLCLVGCGPENVPGGRVRFNYPKPPPPPPPLPRKPIFKDTLEVHVSSLEADICCIQQQLESIESSQERIISDLDEIKHILRDRLPEPEESTGWGGIHLKDVGQKEPVGFP